MAWFILIVWVGLSVLVGMWFREKGRSYRTGLIVSLLLSPLIGLVIGGGLSPRREAIDKQADGDVPSGGARFFLLHRMLVAIGVYACLMLTVIAILLYTAAKRIPQEPFAVQGWEGVPAYGEVPEIPQIGGGVAPEPVLVRIEGR